ncbi:hypothetical protein BC629DRAFT_1591843 [Irpex lacteus]|nr:hypothetical protein BC629DRAFT_1591843 [Irpex lacteus]
MSPLINFADVSSPRIRVETTFGAGYIGNIAAAVIYGLTCLQTYNVFREKKDRVWLRTLIVTLWLFSTLHLVAVSSTLYYYTITNYANIAALTTQNLWAATTYYIITGLMEFIIRGVFTWRVWKLSNQNWLLAPAIVVMSLVDLAGSLVLPSLAFAISNLYLTTFPDISSISWMFYMAFIGSIAADVVTAIALCILLKKRSTGFKRTDSFIRTMMLYSVNTGALSSLCSLMVLVLYVSSHNTFLYVPFYFILPGVMLGSLLATLDAGKKAWDRSHSSGEAAVISIPMSAIRFTNSDLENGTTHRQGHGRGPALDRKDDVLGIDRLHGDEEKR